MVKMLRSFWINRFSQPSKSATEAENHRHNDPSISQEESFCNNLKKRLGIEPMKIYSSFHEHMWVQKAYNKSTLLVGSGLTPLVFILLAVIANASVIQSADAFVFYRTMANCPGCKAGVPGNNGVFSVYHNITPPQARTFQTLNGRATIYWSLKGSATFEMWHKTANSPQDEYWGYAVENIDAATTPAFKTYTRMMPYAGNANVPTTTFNQVNSKINATVSVIKPGNYPYASVPSIYVDLKIKQPNGSTRTYTSARLTGSGTAFFNNINLPVKGQYKYQIFVKTVYRSGGPRTLTDSWSLTNGPKVVIPRYKVTASELSGHAHPVSPSLRTVSSGSSASFTVYPDSYHVRLTTLLRNTCGAGSWNGNTYTVSSVTGSCSVEFQFMAVKGWLAFNLANSGLATLNGTWKIATHIGNTYLSAITRTTSTTTGKVSVSSGPLSPTNYGYDVYFTANDGVSPAVTEYWGSGSAPVIAGTKSTNVKFTRYMPYIQSTSPSATTINSTQSVTLTPKVFNNSGQSLTMRVTVRLLDSANKVLKTKSGGKMQVPSLSPLPTITFSGLAPGTYKKIAILENWMNGSWQPVDHTAPQSFVTVTSPQLEIVNPGNPNLNGTWTAEFYNSARSLVTTKLVTGSVTTGKKSGSIPPLTAGSYTYKVYFQANDGFNVKEFWGQGSLTAPLTRSPIVFTRYMPWIAGQVAANPKSVVTGGNATVNIAVINHASLAINVRCKAQIVNGATVITSALSSAMRVNPNGGTGTCKVGFSKLTANGAYKVNYWLQAQDTTSGIWRDTDHGGPVPNVITVHVSQPGATLTGIKITPNLPNVSGGINAGKRFKINAVVSNNGQTNQTFWVGSKLMDPHGAVVADYPPVQTTLLQQPTVAGNHVWPSAGGQPIMANLVIPATNSVTGKYTVRVAVWNKKPQVGVTQTPLASVDTPLAVSAVWEQKVQLTANGPVYIIPIGSGGTLDASGNPQWTVIPQNKFYVKDSTGKEIQLTNAITPNDGAKLYAMSNTLNWLLPLPYMALNNEISTLSYKADKKLGQIGGSQSWQAGTAALVSFTSGTTISWSAGAAVCGVGAFFTLGTSCAVGAVIGAVGTATSAVDAIASAADEYRIAASIYNQNAVGLINGRTFMNHGFSLFQAVEYKVNKYIIGIIPLYSDLAQSFNDATQGMSDYNVAATKFSFVGIANTFSVKRYTKAAMIGAIPLGSTISAIKNYVDTGMPTPQLNILVRKDLSKEKQRLDKQRFFGHSKQVAYSAVFAKLWKRKSHVAKVITMSVTPTPIAGSSGVFKITATPSGITVGGIASYFFEFGDGKGWLSQMNPPFVAMNVTNHTYTTTGTFQVKVTVTAVDGRSATKTVPITVSQVSTVPVLSALKINGTGVVNEGTTLPLSATAIFSDKSTKAVAAVWSVDVPPSTAVISASGVITARQVTGNKVVNVTAKYVFGNITVYASKVVVINDLNLPVVDNIKPVVTPPKDLILPASSNQGVPVSNPAVVAFLNGATVIDNIDTGLVAHQGVSVLPVMYPPGITTIKFIATDRAGNIGTATAKINVKLADLSIFNSNGQTTVVSGSAVNYTIAVKNNGISDVIGGTVTDKLPTSLTGATWACVALTGSSCTANGTGNITDMAVNLLKGGTATYTLTAIFTGKAPGNLVNTATIAAPVGVPDLNQKNNSATDTDLIVASSTNLAPAPAALPISIKVGQIGTTQVKPNDPNVGDTHTYAVTTQPQAGNSATVSTTGLVTYTAAAGFKRPDFFVVTVTDQGKLKGAVRINVTVNTTSGDTIRTYNLNNNLTPPDMTLTTKIGNVGFAGGKLVANAVDALGYLETKYSISGSNRIRAKARASLAYSYWGMSVGIDFVDVNGTSILNSNVGTSVLPNKSKHFAVSGGGSFTLPAFGDYFIEMDADANQVLAKVYDANNQLLTTLTPTYLVGKTFADIDKIRFVVYATTQNNAMIDDLLVAQGSASVLQSNTLSTAKYGFNYGSSANKTSLKLNFTSNGKDRLLHVQSYDIDFPDEVAVYLNGTLLGHLTGKNNTLGKDSLWMLPATQQKAGTNIIEFRERVAGWKWGVARLGIFDAGKFFGNVKIGLAGGDTGHKNGVEFHFQGGVDRTIEMAGWDSDFNNEIGLKLNGKTLANLPKGPNNKATAAYHLLLTKAQLKAGDNIISVNQRMNLAYNWGIAFKAVRDASKGMGVIQSIAKSSQQVNGAVYLIPASAATQLSLTYYDVDFANELSLWVNGKNVGNASVTANNKWGATAQTLTLPANRLNVVEINNRFNPPNRYFWGVKFTGLSVAGATPVADKQAPVIALSGTSPLSVVQGSVFTDPGSTVTDNVDKNLKAVVTGKVNTSVAGTYTITYNATDTAGNKAKTIIRIVKVGTITAPTLKLNGMDTVAKYGFNYGSSANKTSLKLSFKGDGKDRLLHVQSYDIDFPDEVAVYLNGILLGHLTGKNNTLGKDSLWMLPAGLQVTGNNIIEFRERVAGWKWGVTRLGIFDAGKFFGNVKIGLVGGDTGHKNGVEFHFQGGVDRTIELAGWDSDFSNEIGLKLNGKTLANLPKGPNNKATPTYHLLLTKAQLKAGDNMISVNQRINLAYNWGIAFKAVRDASKGMGVIQSIAKSSQQVNGAVYLIPASAATQLSLTYYDVDFANELSLWVNGKNIGNASVTANNKWGTTAQTLTLPANKLNVVEINNRFNPPNRYFWGVKFTGLQ